MNEAGLERIVDWIVRNFIQIFFILSLFIQISPIKWNPISSFVKWFGKIINSDLQKQIKTLSKQMEEMRNDLDSNEKDRIRWEILDFANSCRNGRNHAHDEFKHIAELHDKYTSLLAKTGDENGVFTTEYQWITTVYQEKLKDNSFLK